ncbi:mRNA-capping enzyme subunit alpha, putative [Entamoeba invadens IP1]|uniref:mRNA-capping enzyme subunit alpha, putative n=1 Tax=Entamoeba invadens IP1 TaxID=370355 RepID=UPI0002C3CF15|nr:mRNA-capping enzyme subunit alpha, putative [Entamoeba invadens IP1]ELP93468.1 mRNA-capping enzyme subunit alpha, putative [Entamoeba invadens IP1]|eukprot:XP_004260239.1 mRNA-capping enzyme subunit alpha, putative [Entamoeba invadens IP1]
MRKKTVYDVENSIRQYEEFLRQITLRSDYNTEVETRFGTIENGRFISGIKQEEFHSILGFANRSETLKQTETNTTEHIFKNERNDTVRVVDAIENGEKVRYVEVKESLRKEEIVLGRHEYGLRVALSRETQEAYNSDTVYGKERMTRQKHRYTFYFEDFFHVDFTDVVQHSFEDDKKTRSYEVEFEFDSNVIADYLGDESKPRLREKITKYMGYINNFRDLIKKSHGNYFKDLEMNKEYSLGFALSRFVCDSITGTEGQSNNFPGAMPVNFGRTSFEIIQKSPYIVSEKTDGVRHFVLVTEKEVYLVTRKMEFYKVNFPEFVEISGKHGVSLFDGEIVRNINTFRPVLMLFDAMIVDGYNITKQIYSERIKKIEEVVQRYNELIQEDDVQSESGLSSEKKVPTTERVFDIIVKTFFKKEDIKKIFEMICFNDQIDSYVIQDELRCHRSDGIIFAPDIPYQPFANPGLFKWKYMTHWTIDYGIKEYGYYGDNREMLFTVDRQRDIIMRELNFSNADLDAFDEDKEKYGWNTSGVVETSFDVWTGRWKYLIYRYDKPKPNHISVCVDTLEAMACNISQEELIYRCSVPLGEDRWTQLYFNELKKQVEAFPEKMRQRLEMKSKQMEVE